MRRVVTPGSRPGSALLAVRLIATTALFVGVPAASAMLPIDIPPDRERAESEVRITFTLPAGDIWRLAREHRDKCQALGPERCQVVQFMPNADSPGGGSTEVLLAPASATAFVADISKTSGKVGLRVDRAGERSAVDRDRLELERELAQAQLDKVDALETAWPADRAAILDRERSRVTSRLRNATEQLRVLEVAPALHRVSLSYQTPGDYPRSRFNNTLSELWMMGFLGFLIVTGVALLTVLYCGILGLSFLKLRKFAIKRGLLKGGSATLAPKGAGDHRSAGQANLTSPGATPAGPA